MTITADRAQLETFFDAMFVNATATEPDKAFVALRAFHDGGANRVFKVDDVDLFQGRDAVINAAFALARQSAAAHEPIVFCPPIAVFKKGRKAREEDILQGLAISVECDAFPCRARRRLETLLGPATMVVASGGAWINPETGEAEDKLHLHWRLVEPASGSNIQRLKLARNAAASIVGGDASNIPACHPIRWPGSIHRKGDPRAAEVICAAETEIDLDAACELLGVGHEPAERVTGRTNGAPFEPGIREDWTPLIENIRCGEDYHRSVMTLAAKLTKAGMAGGAAVNMLRGIMEGSPFRDDRWRTRFEDIPRAVATAGAKFSPAGNGRDDGAREPASILRVIEEFDMERVDWLWKNWIALGKLHLIAGAPEAGKTTIGLAYIAVLSSGGTWPDGTRANPVNCLLWTGEDKITDTIKPRLARMGADMKRVYIVTGHPRPDGKPRLFCPATDMPGLEAASSAIPGGAAFLMLDPVVAAITLKANSHNNAETRNSLQPVVEFAEQANCAVLGVTHFTKGTAGNDPIERVTGSLAFGALPRIVMAAAKRRNQDSDPTAPRILVLAKSNIGPSGGGFGYDVDAAPLYELPDIIATRIVWQGRLEGTARELIAEAEETPAAAKDKSPKLTEAKRFLEASLSNGSRPQKEIEAEASREGFSERTLWSASKELGILKTKNGLGAWSWAIT